MAQITTSSTMKITPSHAVFNTAELLEQILSHLSMREIISNTRVARNWKPVVDGSPILQKALWLRPLDTTVIVPDKGIDVLDVGKTALNMNGDLNLRELLSILRKPTYPGPISLNPLTSWGHQANVGFALELEVKEGAPIHPHPLIPILFDGHTAVKAKYNRRFVTERFSVHGTPYWDHTECSWRRMFLTQPPIKQAQILVPDFLESAPPTASKWVLVEVKGGVTLGDINDGIAKSLGNCSRPLIGYHDQDDYFRRWGKDEFAVFITKAGSDRDE